MRVLYMMGNVNTQGLYLPENCHKCTALITYLSQYLTHSEVAQLYFALLPHLNYNNVYLQR